MNNYLFSLVCHRTLLMTSLGQLDIVTRIWNLLICAKAIVETMLCLQLAMIRAITPRQVMDIFQQAVIAGAQNRNATLNLFAR